MEVIFENIINCIFFHMGEIINNDMIRWKIINDQSQYFLQEKL